MINSSLAETLPVHKKFMAFNILIYNRRGYVVTVKNFTKGHPPKKMDQ